MAYIRSKYINGYGPYYYEVKSVREGKRVRQVFIRYVGRSPGGSNAEAERAAFEQEWQREKALNAAHRRKVHAAKNKRWDRYHSERNDRIRKATGCSAFQAESMANRAWRRGVDPDKVDWDELQCRDLAKDEKMHFMSERLDEMYGGSDQEHDYEAEAKAYEEDREVRRQWREQEAQESQR